jgi:hypothetical protein
MSERSTASMCDPKTLRMAVAITLLILPPSLNKQLQTPLSEI